MKAELFLLFLVLVLFLIPLPKRLDATLTVAEIIGPHGRHTPLCPIFSAELKDSFSDFW